MYRKQQQHQQQKRNYSNKRLCCQLVKNQPVDPILTKSNTARNYLSMHICKDTRLFWDPLLLGFFPLAFLFVPHLSFCFL